MLKNSPYIINLKRITSGIDGGNKIDFLFCGKLYFNFNKNDIEKLINYIKCGN
jgi:hypothetical protein